MHKRLDDHFFKGDGKMAYTAFEKMRKKNVKEFHDNDIGPKQPYLVKVEDDSDRMKAAAMRFLHERCEDLRFDADIEKQEEESGKYQGNALKKEQVPYNMQMDTDRLCLERALERFLVSGGANDAFDVYFCYIEMFIGTYENEACRRMVEKLSEYEENGSSLLMKHRDHYSHSVYVFALGLSIYESNEAYRQKYKNYYGFTDEKAAAHHFLEYWGLASLFHDIGYPFELPFEQIEAYFEDIHDKSADKKSKQRDKNPYISFNGIESYIKFNEKTAQAINRLYAPEKFSDSNELFSYDIFKKLEKVYGKTREEIRNTLIEKPSSPDKYSYYMDHAYFSATMLFKTLCDDGVLGVDKLTKYHIDAMTAIILHNSLYKFSITIYKDEKINQPFKAELHPLAYMLMLCDELQCWDRASYGRNSRKELHPMDCTFGFDGNTIIATYWHDEDEIEEGKVPKFKKEDVLEDIGRIVDLKEIKLEVHDGMKKAVNNSKNIYISASNFIHLYNFAVALNARYNHQGEEKDIDEETLESEFNSMSLEYKLSNIGQAKAFAGHLEAIGCFYTDRSVAFPILKKFTDEQMNIIGPLEHERWLREHIAMGWNYSLEYTKTEKTDKELSKMQREQTRGHMLMIDLKEGEELTSQAAEVHYEKLDSEEQGKDTDPMNSMLELIKKYDGLRIYQYKEIK